MSDIDRVFARLGGGQPNATGERELRSIPRKGRSTGSRTVEVVRLPPRGGASRGETSRRTDFRVRAESWEDGFPARSVPPPASSEQPVTAETADRAAAEPVAHLMPGWEPTAVEREVEPTLAVPSGPAQPRAKRARRTVTAKSRRVADPFDATDDGANCLRCGYAVEPGRERRGLVTCSACG